MAQRIGLLILGLCTVLLPGCITINGPFSGGDDQLHETRIAGQGRDKILWLNIQGLISGQAANQALGLMRTSSQRTRLLRALDKAEQDRHIKAVVVHIDSPGGTVSASDEIYHRLQRFKQATGIPVIASLGGVAASGGYYIAMAADKVIAEPMTLTGSIGVIIVDVNAAGLMAKLGLKDTSVTSGANKDLMSPLRPPRSSDKAIMQGIVDDLYQHFVQVVMQNRPHLQQSRLEEITDGRIFTARQAQGLGLVDAIGYRDRVLAAARQAAGMKQARIIRYYQGQQAPDTLKADALAPSDLKAALSTLSTAGPALEGPQPMYIWRGAAQ